ncbi:MULTISPECIES: hypothetical protein [Aquimarina]|uniref:hypothetical protein n=1 Tax=Aquimarina TaxID=290174 RepID=UPI0004B6DE21|nr:MULTISPECIES: hypothetical protein [Aquimarina]
MKYYLTYIVFIFLTSSCKTDNKQTINNLADSEAIDSIIPQTLGQQKAKTLREKLVGQRCDDAHNLARSEGYYIPGGFLIGSTFNNEHIVDGKTFGITRISGKKGEEKNYSTYLILKQSYEDKSSPCKIVDVLEVDKETDIFKKFPNKDIDIFSDVLVNNERAPELLALAEYEEAGIMTKVYKVWRVNRKTGKFEEINDLSNITVINEDF